jgi:glycosyltransferase involved in cell wall biosynthesis
MKVLLVQNLPHLTGTGGAIRSNRILLEQLAARGHDCHVVAPAGATAARLRSTVEAAGGVWLGAREDGFGYRLAAVAGHALPSTARMVRQVRRVVDGFRPYWVLVPSDDPGGLVLGAALVAAPRRVVYLVHTLQRLPFGPGAFHPSPALTGLVRRAAGVVAVSRAAQDYVSRWAGLPSRLIYPQVYGEGPFPVAAGNAVTIVNPCGYKGVDIFLGLADAFPSVRFLAVASWGTTAADRRALAGRRNVEVVEPVEDIDDVLRRTRIMLVPSLWDETFGYTVVEAMLRGIPVMASAVGGLREAKLGVPYLLAVNRIERYDRHADPALPVPAVPRQDLAPWVATLRRLLDPAHHAEIGTRSREAAAGFVAGLDPGALERYLAELAPSSWVAASSA